MVFALLLLLAGYAGLTSQQLTSPYVNDKALHLLTFFLLTVAFYWIIDTTRRRTLHFTLVACTGCLGVGSEILQAILPNGREFDLFDVVANLVGSLLGLAVCGWYHKRMLERRRQRRYTAVPGEEDDGVGGDGDLGDLVDPDDLELGEGVGVRRTSGDHEEGVVVATAAPAPINTTAAAVATTNGAGAKATTNGTSGNNAMSLEEEVDNWDENAIDNWDDDGDDLGDVGTAAGGIGAAGGDDGDIGAGSKKRSD